jgi:hypothetical protein
MCFVFRQHKAVADVLQCNDDDVNDIYFYLYFSEGEARRSLQTELNTEKARKVNTVKVQQARAHQTFGISTWNLSENDSMVVRHSIFELTMGASTV